MGSKEGSSQSEYADVSREKLTACLTCTLCNHLFTHPTTIIECLHTFCKQCIRDKIIKEQCRHCPNCNRDLGVNPLDKLRSDNSLNELRLAVFGKREKWKKEVTINRRKENVQAPMVDEAVPSSPLLSPNRTERSLSSIAPGGPRIPTAARIMTRRRSKSSRKRRVMFSQASIFAHTEPGGRTEKSPMRSFSPELFANPANNSAQTQALERSNGSREKAKALERSNGSREIAGSTEKRSLSKSSTPVKPGGAANALNFDLNKPAPLPSSSQVSSPISARPTTSKMPRSTRQQLGKAPLDQVSIAKPGDGFGVIRRTPDPRRSIPLWFCLVPENMPGIPQLPNINPSYIKVNPRSNQELAVLHIKKYVAMKLNLPSEEMVDIYFDGQLTIPLSLVRDLINLWPRKPRTVNATVGGSGKDIVPILTYARSMQPPPPDMAHSSRPT